jgi:hypothetical protein
MQKSLPEQFDRGLEDLSRENPEMFHFERTMAVVRSRNKGMHSLMTNIKNTVERRQLLMSNIKNTVKGFGIVAIVIFAMVLIPAIHKVQVGSIVTVFLPSTSGVETGELLKCANSLGNTSQMNISQSPDGTQLVLAFNRIKTAEALKQVQTAFSPLTTNSSEIEFDSRGVYKDVGGSALAALINLVVHVDASGMTDAEIEAELQSQMPGIHEVDVQTVISGGETERRIEIQWGSDGSTITDGVHKMEFHVTDDGS